MAGLGTAISLPFIAAARSFADAGSALNDMAERTGLSVEALSQLSHAAAQTGTDMEVVEKAVRTTQRQIVAATEGNAEAAASFNALGLSVANLAKLSPDKQFQAIASAVGKIPNPVLKAAMAMKLFGKGGTAIIPLIDDFSALTGEAKALGLVMSTDDAKAADALGDAIDNVSAVVKSAAFAVGAALAPELTALAKSLTEAVVGAVAWLKANRPLVVMAFKVGVAITAVGAALVGVGAVVYAAGAAIGVLAKAILAARVVLGVLVNPLGLVLAAFQGIAAVLGVIVSPFGLVTAAIIAGALAFTYFRETALSAVGAVAGAVGSFASGVKGVLTAIPGAAASAFGALAKAAQSAFGVLTDTLKSIPGVAMGALRFLGSLWSAGVASLADAFPLLAMGARFSLATIADLFRLAAASARISFQVIQGEATATFNLMSSIAKPFFTLWSFGFGMVRSVAKSAFGVVVDLLRPVASAASSAFSALSGFAVKAFSFIVEDAGWAFGLLFKLIPDLGSLWKLTFSALTSSASNAFTAVRTGASAFAGLGSTFSGLGSTLSGLGSTLASVPKWFAGAADSARTFASNALGGITGAVSSVGSALAAIPSYAASAFNGALTAGRQLIASLTALFADLWATAVSTFKGIADALMTGDIQLAGKILWAGLKVEWLKGVAFLQGVWSDWSVAAVEVVTRAQYAISGIMIDLVDSIRVVWASLTADLSGSWGDLIKTFIFSLNPLAQALQALGFDVSGLIDQGLNAVGLTTGQSEAKRQTALAGIGQGNIDAHAALNQQQAMESDARKKGADATVEAARKAVADAQAKLDALNKVAATKVAVMADTPAAKKPGAGPDLGALAPEMQKAAAKIDVAGTFNALGAAGLGAGSTLGENQLKEAKKQTVQLEKVNRNLVRVNNAFT